MILAAYERACRNVLSVKSELRYTHAGMFVVVRCGTQPTQAVKVVYTGVTVPSLVGLPPYALSSMGAMLDLRIVVSSRRARPRETAETIVAQHPSAGQVVPLGTTMAVIVAN